MTKDINLKICDNYYQLGSKERKWLFPLNVLSRKYYSGKVRFEKNSMKDVEIKASKTRVKLVLNYLYPVLEFLGFSNFITKTNLSKEFCDWVDEFAPDIIYAQATSRESILFCKKVQEYLDKPFVFHMMDDWPSLINPYWKSKVNREFSNLLQSVDLAMGISDFMAEEYNHRYQKHFVTYHNPIDIEFWRSGEKVDYSLDKEIVLLYAGRIGLGIDKSLMTIAKAVNIVNNDLGVSINFVIQSSVAPSWINDYPCVEHRGFVSYNNLPLVFGQADFLILPYDFTPSSLNYIKYSMPTKVSEYMASGTPIIVFAPEDTALARYAKKREWAGVVEENNILSLVQELKSLVQDVDYRRRLGENAKSIARKRHNMAEVSGDFQNALLSVARDKGEAESVL